MSRAMMMMICMLATSLAVSVGCFAQAPRVIAQKLCDQMDQSLADQDLDRVLGFYDSSYVGTDQHGKREAFADVRKRLEQGFPVFRRMNPSTVVEDVQLEAGRMVVYSKTEMHFEFHDQRNGWVPEIYKGTGESTWERKGGQWKLVRSTTFRADYQVDPKYDEEQKVWSAIIQHHYEAAQRVAESMGSNTRH